MERAAVRIPEDLPTAWNKAYTSVVQETPNPAQRSHIFSATKRHVAFCKTFNRPFLSMQSIMDHRHYLRGELCEQIASTYTFTLARIAMKGSDKRLRDDLLEHFRFRRTAKQLLKAPYIPCDVRRLATRALERQELNQRDLVVFDLYLRVVDRLCALPATPSAIVAAFWRRPPGIRHQCSIFGKVSEILDLLMPGHLDANTLRITQRSLRAPRALPRERPRKDAAPEIDALVDAARQVNGGARGRAYAKSKKKCDRSVLMCLESALNEAGRPFALDREAINIFADHAKAKHHITRDQSVDCHCLDECSCSDGWSAIYIARMFETLARYVLDPSLRKDLLTDSSAYHRESQTEPKAKQRVLSERPTNLPALYLKSKELLREAAFVPNKCRSRLVNTAAALAFLCVYPLRRADLVDLRYGEHLLRALGGWCLASLPTQKTGLNTEPLRLPVEITSMLDAALLQGAAEKHLWKIYADRKGQCLWSDWKTGRPHSKALLTLNLSELAGYSPHILRTIWADHLVENGADKQKISVVLQHKSLMSQKDYEVLAAKLRLKQAVVALREIADGTHQNVPINRRLPRQKAL